MIELVDAASSAYKDKDSFRSAAAALCRFVSNAGFTVDALKLNQVASRDVSHEEPACQPLLGRDHIAMPHQCPQVVGEVVYEGSEPRRRLERVYSGCLALAAPELLATMGLGDEQETAGAVGLDAVEQVRVTDRREPIGVLAPPVRSAGARDHHSQPGPNHHSPSSAHSAHAHL